MYFIFKKNNLAEVMKTIDLEGLEMVKEQNENSMEIMN